MIDISKKKLKYKTSTTPRKWKLLVYELILFISGPFVRFFLRKKFENIEVIGKRNLEGGPYILLMNHSCPIDPLLMTFFGGIPLQFLISESFMQQGLASHIAGLFGQITKRKLDMDTTSIKLLRDWVKVGGRVAMFPEGAFSWDGTPNPILPGLDQLIRMLNIPVVCVNLQNGSRVRPAWATEYRKTSIRINIHPPISFNKDSDILEIIKNKIFDTKTVFPSSGNNLSNGISKILRYCPECKSEKSIKEKDNSIECSHCSEKWEITADNQVIGVGVKNITDLLKASYQTLDQKWQDKPFFQSLNTTTLFDISSKDWVKSDEGDLVINNQAILVGETLISNDNLLGYSMDWADIVLLRTKQKRYAIQVTDDSRALITHALDKVVNVPV